MRWSSTRCRHARGTSTCCRRPAERRASFRGAPGSRREPLPRCWAGGGSAMAHTDRHPVGQTRLQVPEILGVTFSFNVVPPSRARATRTTSCRNSLGYGFGMGHILSRGTSQHHRVDISHQCRSPRPPRRRCPFGVLRRGSRAQWRGLRSAGYTWMWPTLREGEPRRLTNE